MAHYDLTEVIKRFINHEYGESERSALVNEISAYMSQPAREPNWLAAQVAQHAAETTGCTPMMTVKLGVMYGIVIGILAEQERAGREHRRLQ